MHVKMKKSIIFKLEKFLVANLLYYFVKALSLFSLNNEIRVNKRLAKKLCNYNANSALSRTGHSYKGNILLKHFLPSFFPSRKDVL